MMRVTGRGIPDVRSSRHRGDLYIRLVVKVPEKLSSSDKKLIEELEL
jgi:DnaJ-class molecular chaperone